MKKKVSILNKIAFCAVFLFLIISTPLSSSETTSTNFKGKTADASWYSENDGIFTEVYLFSSESILTESSMGSNSQSTIFVSIYQYKLGEQVCYNYNGQVYCYYNQIPLELFFSNTPINTGEFKVNGRLNSATLHTTVTGDDYLSGLSKTVTLDISWAGQGPYSSGKNHYQYRSVNTLFNGYNIGLFREAVANGAVSGDISVDLGNSSYGSLNDAKSGYVEIIRK